MPSFDLQTMKYDYIIAGSGCAGLSLLYGILNKRGLCEKRILVIDKDVKNQNDRTWCFWEKEEGVFESIVYHKWKHLKFISDDFSKKFDLREYTYKMIRGIDFYSHVFDFARKFENVDFVNEKILSINELADSAVVKTDQGEYEAPIVFNSTSLFNPEINTKNSLLQHFEGWVIKTDKPTFNDKVGTLMDFTPDQKHGATFMYVLPTSEYEALVEYTLFSPRLLNKEDYKIALRDYIKNVLKIEHYTTLHEEFGVIPMSLATFPRKGKKGKRIVNIGTAGGFTKASSGYTFQFIQKNVKKLVSELKDGQIPANSTSFRDKVYQWYDRTMLDVILSEKMEGKEIFEQIFKKLDAHKILAFLGNESTLTEEIRVMSSLPIFPFLTSGIKQLAIDK